MSNRATQYLSAAALVAVLGVAGCHKDAGQQADGTDPAAANMATNDTTNGQPAQENYPQQAQQPQQAESQPTTRAPRRRTSSGTGDQSIPPAPPEDTSGSSGYANAPNYQQGSDYSGDYGDQGQYPVVEAQQPPPPLPEYEQPECPGDNYIWTPGYWNYASAGYYFVPGVWVVAPYAGSLWTPGYWGYDGGRYRFNHGYWGDHIGFYGGISYGFGYFGHGYEGGYWNHDHFFYNQAVTHVNENVIHNVYQHNVTVNNVTINNYNSTNNRTINNVSYNGGHGGVEAKPVAFELAAQHEQHLAPLPAQVQHVQQASQNRAQFASASGGRPQMLAAAKPIEGHMAPTPPRFQANRTGMAPAINNVHPGNQPQPALQNRSQQNQRAQTPAQNNAARPGQPEAKPPVNEARPGTVNHPMPQPQHPVNTPAAQQNHPQPQRPAEQNQGHPAQPARPAYTPAPQQHTAQPAPHTESRPTPQPAPKPQPQARPETQSRPAPQARPQTEQHTAPAPQQHAPPQQHSQPQHEPAAHPEERPH